MVQDFENGNPASIRSWLDRGMPSERELMEGKVCMCDWAGSECCPVHFNPRDWEEE